jgi:hypothetical protein
MLSKPSGLWIIAAGVVLVLIGALVYVGALSWFGRLPGDVRYESDNVRFYFPITTMIVISLGLSLLLWLLRRL